VLEPVYARFTEILVEKVRRLHRGPARVFENFIGPVISREALQGIMEYIALGRRKGRLLIGGISDLSSGGFFIAPTIFDRLAKNSPLWQEEIFGPVLALAEVKSFEEGIEQANATVYGLTGAVYSQNPQHLEKARRDFFCGNLYLNRKCTGALVGGHPFGGFNLSGTDSKAGGPDYLLLFRQGQAITEKI
jgi:1-pyrroline-5-carboxylate dehydrogenase